MKKIFITPIVLLITVFTLQAQTIDDNSLKTNVKPVEKSLTKIVKLEPKQFEYNSEYIKMLNLEPGQQYGFLVEDVEKLFPSLVKTKTVNQMFGKNVYRRVKVKTIDEAGLIPLMIASLKEKQVAIDDLKGKLKLVEQKL